MTVVVDVGGRTGDARTWPNGKVRFLPPPKKILRSMGFGEHGVYEVGVRGTVFMELGVGARCVSNWGSEHGVYGVGVRSTVFMELGFGAPRRYTRRACAVSTTLP